MSGIVNKLYNGDGSEVQGLGNVDGHGDDFDVCIALPGRHSLGIAERTTWIQPINGDITDENEDVYGPGRGLYTQLSFTAGDTIAFHCDNPVAFLCYYDDPLEEEAGD